LLICDEWGYVPKMNLIEKSKKQSFLIFQQVHYDSDGSKLLFQIISECYERKSVIITTNLEFAHWNDIFADTKITAALLDRVIHHSHLLDFTHRDSRRRTELVEKSTNFICQIFLSSSVWTRLAINLLKIRKIHLLEIQML